MFMERMKRGDRLLCVACGEAFEYEGRGRRPEYCHACRWYTNKTCSFCKRSFLAFPSWRRGSVRGPGGEWLVGGKVACKRCHRLLTGRAKTVTIREPLLPWTLVFHTQTGRAYIRDRKNPKVAILRYRLFMECHLGKPLDWDQIVHHKDGDPTNDSIENLELTTQSEHQSEHMKERWSALRSERVCSDCGRSFSGCIATRCRSCAFRETGRKQYQKRKGATSGEATHS